MIIVSIIICVILISLVGVLYVIYKNNKKNEVVFSFKESMDLTEFPIITLYNGNTKLNFLLDTGSNSSIINKNALSSLKYSKVNCEDKSVINGISGESVDSDIITLKVNYKDQDFIDNFLVADLNHSFNIIKNTYGVQLHGILGSMFFKRYEYILDFKELKAYVK